VVFGFVVGQWVGSEVAFFCLLLTGEKVTNEENEIEPVLKKKKKKKKKKKRPFQSTTITIWLGEMHL
jgi:hypothetical protein